MPKLVSKPAKDTYTPPQRSPTVQSSIPAKPRVKIPPLVLGQIQDIPDTVGFSCRHHNSTWVIVDRRSKILKEQPKFEEYEVARAYADALNEEITRRRFRAEVRGITRREV